MLSRLAGFFFKKLFHLFFKLLPLADLAIENELSGYLKMIMAVSFKFGQLIQGGELYN